VRLRARLRVGTSTVEHEGEVIGISPKRMISTSRAKLEVGSQIGIQVPVPMRFPGGPLLSFSSREGL